VLTGRLLSCHASLHVPLRVIRKKTNGIKYPPSISRKLRKKATAWRLIRHVHTTELRRSYKLATECRIVIHPLVAKQEERLVDNGNIGAFYRYSITMLTINLALSQQLELYNK